jgi:hypothetical protein
VYWNAGVWSTTSSWSEAEALPPLFTPVRT